MSIDSGILIYIIFLAIILYSNYQKKRKRTQAQSERMREAASPQTEGVVVTPRASQSQPPDIFEWVQTLWAEKEPEVSPPPASHSKSLHEQRREKAKKEKYAERPQRYTTDMPREVVGQPALQVAGRRVPVSAARFKTRDDLRRAVVARVVLAPPKSLE